MLFVVRHGLRWRDAPRDQGPHKAIYNYFIWWSISRRMAWQPVSLKKRLYPDISGAAEAG